MLQAELASVVQAVIACPTCDGGMTACPGLLQCQKCGREVRQSSEDWFFSLRDALPAQGRSLLVNEERSANPWIVTFGAGVNSGELQGALAKCQPNSLVDIGCAGGDYYAVLKDQVGFYYGLEPSPIPDARKLRSRPPDNVILVHNDPAEPLPIGACSTDMVTFLASYDHIPNRLEVLRQAWQSLRPGGHLLVCMTNYGFWAKRVLNAVFKRRMALHAHEHYCVHDPSTLHAEVTANCSGATMSDCRADYTYIPNTPFTWLYRNRTLLAAVNRVLRAAIHGALGCERAGSTMICVFRKDLPA